jgi:hypothetical protein
LSNYG